MVRRAGKSKKYTQSRKKRYSYQPRAQATTSQTVAPEPRPTLEARPQPKVQPRAVSRAAGNPYLGRELRRIGLLAGGMILVLIILAVVLG